MFGGDHTVLYSTYELFPPITHQTEIVHHKYIAWMTADFMTTNVSVNRFLITILFDEAM